MITFFPERAIAVSLGSVDVRWYGLMYLLAFIFAYVTLPHLAQYRKIALSRDAWVSIIIAGMIGVIAGGRLGYVLFYEPVFYWQQPIKILAINEGGMSFHGGLLGVAAAVWLMSRRYRVSLLSLLDLVIIPAAIGLALGRLGNFINHELYGTATTAPWGITVPGVPGYRHPAPLYAAGKDLVIAAICAWYFFRSKSYRTGMTTALFLTSYGVLRFAVGFYRAVDGARFTLAGLSISEGQLLSLPLIIAGSWLFFSVRSRRSLQPSGYEEGTS